MDNNSEQLRGEERLLRAKEIMAQASLDALANRIVSNEERFSVFGNYLICCAYTSPDLGMTAIRQTFIDGLLDAGAERTTAYQAAAFYTTSKKRFETALLRHIQEDKQVPGVTLSTSGLRGMLRDFDRVEFIDGILETDSN